ncbi:ArsR family transcriptional regulator [Desertihabitans brevis]|uniref:ArsR family transcriptional regulator n=1 Tax=Desertihabitans brevis TaxID=2268447 RepID=A0A367YVS7_9ACTN|nr:helix-turn-helix domain-containing protein [Desertihabitans brevis]RCK69995.1 ArsR family transcriptional regulator [Desertihabitans brevis]
MTPEPQDHLLTEARALAALASPVRSRILDALRVDGPSTASMLADRLDQAVGSISHHLKVLAEANLVEEAPELARDRRERWWRRAGRRTRWSRDQMSDPDAVDAALAAENLQLARQFERAQSRQDHPTTPGSWEHDTSFAIQSWFRMTDDELATFGEELIALFERWAGREIPDDGRQREPVLVFARGFPAEP